MGGLLVLLLMACSSSSSDGNDPETQPKDKPVLKLYVFPPDKPIVTRANTDVDPLEGESDIKSIHVWVFYHSSDAALDGKPVGHISLNNLTLTDGRGEVTMDVSDDFADKVADPAVNVKLDVYVAANVTVSNCGLTLDENTSREQLINMLIGSSHFGVTSGLVSSIPDDGLPMSGMLTNQNVFGESPVFRLGSATKLANVRLLRAVSKMRFVFCKSVSNTDELVVNSIKLDGDVLPTTEYLFLNGVYPEVRSHPGSEYENEALLISGVDATMINANADPSAYSYNPATMTGQDYETLINDAVRDGYLSDLGRFYLKESGRKLKGTITYKINHSVEKIKTFEMKEEGDFTRNHTWIVYGFFVSSGDLIVNMVEVKNWDDGGAASSEVYNW